jgi:hypothetical protein
MSTSETTTFRKIVVSGVSAAPRASAPAISLRDEAGSTLHTARIHEDGSCELSEEALAAAHDMLVGPITVALPAQEFRGMAETEGIVDIAARLAGPAHETPVAAPALLARFGDGASEDPDWHHGDLREDK